ncbi:MAG: hypothetical protein IIB00_02640 [candidate division Zixibacteria bacterium]|nr:hypothetical protein [candidate division Zixibacteria bacterium]
MNLATTKITSTLTLSIFIIAWLIDAKPLWGVNHLIFLETIKTWLIVTVCILVAFIWSPLLQNQKFDSAIDYLGRVFWSNNRWPRILFAVVFVGIAFIFQVQTHFLGDGYTWLSNFSNEFYFPHKWTEPISIPVLRTLQWALGEYNYETALLAFRIISFASGFIVISNLFSIFGRLCEVNSLRFIGVFTFVLSGVSLQFFGYVEFYSPLWAAMTTFFLVALKYIKDGRGFWVVISFFLLSILLHVQALYLAGGVSLLLYDRYMRKFGCRSANRQFYSILLLASILLAITLVWLYNSMIEVETMFLPLISGSLQKPSYSMLSPKHIFDIANLIFLLFPGVLILVALFIGSKSPKVGTMYGHFLILSSIGSLTFLLVIDPVIGLGRDWDLMSATLFPPGLLLFHWLNSRTISVSGKSVVIYLLVCCILSGAFLATNIDVRASETRFHSLLRYYGTDNRSGWIIFGIYLKNIGDSVRLSELEREMIELFPEGTLMNHAIGLNKRGKPAASLKVTERLISKDPHNPIYLQIRGRSFHKLGQIDSSIYCLELARKLSPYRVEIIAELGEVYLKSGRIEEALKTMKSARRMDPHNELYNEGVGMAFLQMGNLDSALSIAAFLLNMDSLSVSGHLLALMATELQGDISSAKRHYNIFKRIGNDRSSYKTIVQRYQYLDQRK